MDQRIEIPVLLISRRAGSQRNDRARRHEVAMLAGVSVDYHTRLEGANLHRMSESVLDAMAQARQLDDR